MRVSILVTMQHVATLTATLERDNMGWGRKYTDVRCHHPKGTVFILMFFLHFFEVWGRSSRVAWPQKQWWNMLDSTGKKACGQRKYLKFFFAESCPFFDASPGSKCATRIRWIPKLPKWSLWWSLGCILGSIPRVLATFAKKKFSFLESLLSTDQLDFC